MVKLNLLFAALLLTCSIQAQQEILLYPSTPSNSKPCTVTENKITWGRVEGVTIPKLYVYQPAKKDSFKTAVLICPGGGYGRLSIEHEGYKVAKALNEKGITAFVLKYRNPMDSGCVNNKETVAIEDAQQALKLIRERAIEFGINPNKFGMLGFSAGGHLTATAATHFTTNFIENNNNTNLRPDYIVLAYPVISFTDSLTHMGSRNNMLGINPSKEKINLYSNELRVTAQTPPTFLMHAADDKTVTVKNSLAFYTALLSNKVPAEMFLFQSGFHGFGLNNKSEPVNWLNLVFSWMTSNKFLKGNVE